MRDKKGPWLRLCLLGIHSELYNAASGVRRRCFFSCKAVFLCPLLYCGRYYVENSTGTSVLEGIGYFFCVERGYDMIVFSRGCVIHEQVVDGRQELELQGVGLSLDPLRRLTVG